MKPSELNCFDRIICRRFLRAFAAWSLLLTLLYSAVCTPIQLWITGDILLRDTLLPTVLDLLVSVLHFAFYWVSFAYLIYTVSRYGVRAGGLLMAIFTGFALMRYAISQLMTYWVMNDVFEWLHLRDMVIYVLLDCLMLAVAFWLIVTKNRQTARGGGLMVQMPLSRLFDFSKPLARVIALIAAIPSLLHLITRLIFDLSVLGGMPTTWFDLIWVLIGYLSELIFALIGYVVIVLILNSQFVNEKKAKLNFENTTLLGSDSK